MKREKLEAYMVRLYAIGRKNGTLIYTEREKMGKREESVRQTQREKGNGMSKRPREGRCERKIV